MVVELNHGQFHAAVCGTGTGASYLGVLENQRHSECADYFYCDPARIFPASVGMARCAVMVDRYGGLF